MSKDVEKLGKCSKCQSEYSERYDAYYCKKCDRWLEKACSDENCSFCTNRPSRPSKGV